MFSFVLITVNYFRFFPFFLFLIIFPLSFFWSLFLLLLPFYALSFVLFLLLSFSSSFLAFCLSSSSVYPPFLLSLFSPFVPRSSFSLILCRLLFLSFSSPFSFPCLLFYHFPIPFFYLLIFVSPSFFIISILPFISLFLSHRVLSLNFFILSLLFFPLPLCFLYSIPFFSLFFFSSLFHSLFPSLS